MTPSAELTPPMDQPRRFPTVEDETPAVDASSIAKTMSTSGSSAATEGTTTTSDVAAAELPPVDIADVVLSSLSEHTKPQPTDSATESADGEKSHPGSAERDAQMNTYCSIQSGRGYMYFPRASLSEHTKPEPMGTVTESADAEKSHPGSAQRDTHLPAPVCIRSGHLEYYTSFPRTSPEQISSIFPTELPPRPPQKQSFLKRLQGSSARPTQTDKQVSHDHTYRTPDIELAAPGEAPRSHGVNRSRSLMFWLLIMLGICLSSIIGIVIHWAVTREE
ncbi:uncharacterized protein J4E88_010854 [Alternaria novae-zelandiae]|uniref:uncharacterized protein n=1 Tax=Alternaria novae-zelandiae TaxID=430562 RepID=UPI0020C50653|nr:uncharacterized protein J4E88_010854 [Alternaria novae-zelandiae]KAI4663149.1 hypothetical protein J4E88_010854 [Alternaria novae-zelandiae]